MGQCVSNEVLAAAEVLLPPEEVAIVSDEGAAAGQASERKESEAVARVMRLFEVEAISLLITSWLTSVSTTNFRASCRRGARLAMRHAPVSSEDFFFYESLEKPFLPQFRQVVSPMGNPYSPLRSWGLATDECFRLLDSTSKLLDPAAVDACRAAGRRIFRDRDFVLAFAEIDGYRALRYGDERFRSDPAIIWAAIQQNGTALKWADETFKKDRDVVLAAIERNGEALEWADRPFTSDRDIVVRAVTQCSRALMFADIKFKRDRDIVMAAVKQDGWALGCADQRFHSDREVVLAAVRTNGRVLKTAAHGFIEDREVAYAALEGDGAALDYLYKFRGDKEFVLTALKYNSAAFQYLTCPLLRTDPDVLRAAGIIEPS